VLAERYLIVPPFATNLFLTVAEGALLSSAILQVEASTDSTLLFEQFWHVQYEFRVFTSALVPLTLQSPPRHGKFLYVYVHVDDSTVVIGKNREPDEKGKRPNLLSNK
tara:strand:+ start:277 stop:600 length:324 start_codon:yes stop_codon:yes gene_type:complete